MALKVSTQQYAKAVVVSMTGDLDLITTPELQKHVETLLSTGSRRIVFDLDGVVFCDSTGLSLFVRTMNACQKADGELRLANLQPTVRRTLEISGLIDVLPAYPTVEVALSGDEPTTAG